MKSTIILFLIIAGVSIFYGSMQKKRPLVPADKIVNFSHVEKDKAPVKSMNSPIHLLSTNCRECHNEKKAKGKFDLSDLGQTVTSENVALWHDVMDQLVTEEMPPEDEGELSSDERSQLVSWFKTKINSYLQDSVAANPLSTARRLSLDEYKNSLRDLLAVENLGTHSPCSSLLDESFNKGFNKLGSDLMMSSYHLNAYIETARKILDNVILDGDKPRAKNFAFKGKDMTASWSTEPKGKRSNWVDLIFPRNYEEVKNFSEFEKTGFYKISVKAQAVDRDYPYSYEDIGFQKEDPLQLAIKIGTETYTLNVPDKTTNLELEQWVTAGSSLKFALEGDGLKMVANGNFKHNATMMLRYPELLDGKRKRDFKSPVNRQGNAIWKYWRGPRVRVHSIKVEGPFYKEWPPLREKNLIGSQPSTTNIPDILNKFAARAYRRPLQPGEVDRIIAYATSLVPELGLKGALKEGIVAILSSVPFIYINQTELSHYPLASKLSYALLSSTPDKTLLKLAAGNKLDDGKEIQRQIERLLKDTKSSAFVENFPNAWFELNKLGFMLPEPEYNHYFHRKDLVVDMKNEVKAFFRHVLQNNLSILEFIEADYSFINQDLAYIYGIHGVKGNKLRHFTFKNGRRGGVLGMGAILTMTAEPLLTSPIHRGVWLKENILGSHPSPPPADVEITEPDLRHAKSIREVLAKHTSDANCRSCHAKIDPWGWAFENYDPSGRWREHYSEIVSIKKGRDYKVRKKAEIDASSKLSNGQSYREITGFKKLLADRHEQIVRCFIIKMLTYINGSDPGLSMSPEIDRLLELSAAKDYRIVDTIVAIFQSPVFRPKKALVHK
ncbi:MAG: DUF1592 domain-containing protein [Lentisphaerales bacterium]|nr:DUF1592 domain-containing protein [Lentisphaerales bacterium]